MSATRLCVLCFLCLHTSVWGNVRTSFFQMYPCSGHHMQQAHLGCGQESHHASSLMECAATCNVQADCRNAVFRSSSHNCTLVSANEPCPPSFLPYTWEAGCSVLYKGQTTGEEWTRKETGRNLEPWLVAPGSAVRMVWSDSSYTYAENIQAVHNTPEGLFFNSDIGFSFDLVSDRYFQPISFEMKTFDVEKNDMWLTRMTVEGQLESLPVQSYSSAILVENGEPNFHQLVYDKEAKIGSQNDVISAVSQGFRPVVRYPAWLEMDPQAGDVVIHMAGMLAAQTSLDMKKPTHLLSIAESTKNGIRHEFRHPISQAPNATYRKVNTQPRWEFDTSWEKLTPSDPTVSEEPSFDDLKKAVLSGREMRVLINGTVSSDVTFVYVNTDDFIFQLADHLAPVADDVAEVTELRVRMTAVTFSRKLFTCEMTYHGVPIHGHKTEYLNNTGGTIEWFVSTRNWTKVLEKTKSGSITFGSDEDLYRRVMQGRKVRLCSNNEKKIEISCFTAVKQSVVSKTKITVQTPFYLRNVLGLASTSDVRKEPCCLVSKTWSSDQFSKTVAFILGQDKSVLRNSVKTTMWFVEI